MQAPMAVAEMFGEACPASAPFFGYMGAAAALIFASEYLCLLLSVRRCAPARAAPQAESATNAAAPAGCC